MTSFRIDVCKCHHDRLSHYKDDNGLTHCVGDYKSKPDVHIPCNCNKYVRRLIK